MGIREWATGEKATNERARALIANPNDAEPDEVARAFQEIVDTRFAHSLNEITITEQQAEIRRLEGLLEARGPKKTHTARTESEVF